MDNKEDEEIIKRWETQEQEQEEVRERPKKAPKKRRLIENGESEPIFRAPPSRRQLAASSSRSRPLLSRVAGAELVIED